MNFIVKDMKQTTISLHKHQQQQVFDLLYSVDALGMIAGGGRSVIKAVIAAGFGGGPNGRIPGGKANAHGGGTIGGMPGLGGAIPGLIK